MKILLPYFIVNGRSSYPVGVELLRDQITFNGTKYWIGEGDLSAETGPDNYSDYDPSLSMETKILSVSYDVASVVMGQSVNVNVVFDDEVGFNPFHVVITDKPGNVIYNLSIPITLGAGSAVFTPDKPVDYFITQEGINLHKGLLKAHLNLVKPSSLVVVS